MCLYWMCFAYIFSRGERIKQPQIEKMLQFGIDNPSIAGQGDASIAVDPLWQPLWDQLNVTTTTVKSSIQWAKVWRTIDHFKFDISLTLIRQEKALENLPYFVTMSCFRRIRTNVAHLSRSATNTTNRWTELAVGRSMRILWARSKRSFCRWSIVRREEMKFST